MRVAPLAAILLLLIAAAWIAVALWATLSGLRRASEARERSDEARRSATLLSAAPALWATIEADDTVNADARLADWLGLPEVPTTAAAFCQALGDRGQAIADEIAAARRAARRATCMVTLSGSGRVMEVVVQSHRRTGGGSGEVVLWFTDMTARTREVERLTADARRIGGALDGLSTLIEAAPFPMWHRGADLRLALVNSAYVRAVEASDAEDVIERQIELLEADGGGAPRLVAAQARENGKVSVRTAPAIIAGQRRNIRIVDVPIGQAGVAGYAVDVEELEEARADLGLFVRAQRDMLDRLSAAVAQFGGDQGLVFYNRHFLRLFQMDPEWLGDRPEFDRVLERMRETQRAPETRDFPGWRAERRAWFNTTDAVEEAWLLPGGTHLRVVAQPLPDRGLLLIFEDRTEHLQLASARDTLLRVRTATFDNLFEAIGVFASDGRLQLWNARFREVWDIKEALLVQHPRVDALVQAIAPKLVDPSRAGAIRDLVRTATVERQQRAGRIALVDGRHFEFAAVPLPDGNALFTLLDITASRGIEEALRERNEALEEADRLKTAFVANMSYELRVPLTSIAGFAEMMAGGYAGPLDDTQRDYVEAILSAVSRLGTLIGDVLDLTQSEAGTLPIAEDPLDLGDLVREAVAVASDAAAAAGLTLVSEVRTLDGDVIGDRKRLRQGLDHLIRNAIRYTQPGGRVLVRCGQVDAEAELVVSDDGPGIPPADRERIFRRFNRTTMDATHDGKPTLGLGLPLTRQFVEAHGGTLRLETEEGAGTTIIIRLPLRPAES